MTAAVLDAYGTPRPGTFPVPSSGLSPDEILIRPLAAAVNGVDRAIASGKHFLSPRTLPVVVGRDGVGLTPDDRLVYFDGPSAPWGSMAEQAVLAKRNLIEIPRRSDPAVAAALGNGGLAAWLPLSWRAGLREGETVAVLGAAGFVGSLALQVARHLGAGRIIGVVRGAADVAHARRLGADAVIDTAAESDLTAALRAASPEGIDVIVDYLWGEVAAAALQATAMGARLVQVGTVAGNTLALSGETMRSRSLDVLGYVSFRAPLELRTRAYQTMVQLAEEGRIEVAVKRYPLSQVMAAWNHVSKGVPSRPVVMAEPLA
ncbi:zinc-binding alcohol dehydrogenase family protein [Bosea caraganae]|uniref:Zinc-binding alcohol dehydrogenase family protein n=1 Tax=Bosea caraganae TaxID=2763117 RepID=A0A370KXE6_9HYPH|nr:zinc-binding alcohol dehydrogenase family protein [Bosea caraganae]RDJ19657.1 zinc-binding alcohol dehydrogenase family protein [Bosea caraganae]RDJ24315.1 zinc-binding alcohol dehydrogenase family protein [Bosea caraganae]